MGSCMICGKKSKFGWYCSDVCETISKRKQVEKMDTDWEKENKEEIEFIEMLTEEEFEEYCLRKVEKEDEEYISYIRLSMDI